MSVGKENMARYIVLASLDFRGIPSYYIVDTSDNSRVRCYDCELWAEHEARRMNVDREEERDRSLLNRLYERLFRKGGIDGH
jgi:hypothetical protein